MGQKISKHKSILQMDPQTETGWSKTIAIAQLVHDDIMLQNMHVHFRAAIRFQVFSNGLKWNYDYVTH